MGIKNQDILRNYAGILGRGEGDVGSVPLLIQALRQRQQDAEETDKANLKSGVKVGKAGLQAGKSFRDFAIARLANPNLSFADFMKNPTVSAKWVKEGASMVAKDPSLMPKSFDTRFGKMGAVGTALRDLGISPERRMMEAELGAKPADASYELSKGRGDKWWADRANRWEQDPEGYKGMAQEQFDTSLTESQDIAGSELDANAYNENMAGIYRDVVDANSSQALLEGRKGFVPEGGKLEDLTYNPQQIDVSSGAYGHIPDPSSEKRGLLERLFKKAEPIQSYQPSEYKGSITSSLLDEVRGGGLGRSESLATGVNELLKEPASEVAKEGAEAVGGEVASAGLGDLFGAGSSLMSMATEGATPTNTLKGAGSLFQLLGLIPGLQPLAGLGTAAKGASYGTRALDIT